MVTPDIFGSGLFLSLTPCVSPLLPTVILPVDTFLFFVGFLPLSCRSLHCPCFWSCWAKGRIPFPLFPLVTWRFPLNRSPPEILSASLFFPLYSAHLFKSETSSFHPTRLPRPLSFLLYACLVTGLLFPPSLLFPRCHTEEVAPLNGTSVCAMPSRASTGSIFLVAISQMNFPLAPLLFSLYNNHLFSDNAVIPLCAASSHDRLLPSSASLRHSSFLSLHVLPPPGNSPSQQSVPCFLSSVCSLFFLPF